MKPLSRREFLKLGAVSLAGLAFTRFQPDSDTFDDIELVRVAKDPVSVYTQPNDTSRIVATWPRDSLIHVYGTVNSGTPGYNPIWYRVFGGYMHRARLQQVRVHYNTPLASLPTPKVIAELTVPFTEALRYNKWDGWSPIYRLYYSSTQWITGIDTGPDGKPWYIIQDEADKNVFYYVPAAQLRPIDPEEYSPLSPDVPAGRKRIEINLSTQTLTCYENDQVWFTTLVSSGALGMETPAGLHNIQVKLPSRNMSTTSPLADDVIPLVGVPWTSFFTDKGHALHGTYWHNNFGVPMSHGCVNMRNEDALKLFRWSTPRAAFEDINLPTLDVKGYGTMVDIHY